MKISEKVQCFSEYAVKTRRYLHQIPELSGEEYKTSAFCKAQMREAGFMITEYDGFTGFCADLHIHDDMTLIAFRADMDALEMEDRSENDFRSTHAGCAHNCGHDTHTAILLTFGCYLSAHRETLTHNVRLIFQMAEEDMRIPGADKLVELGCMVGVSEVYALHNDGSQEKGKVLIREGILSSYGSAWTVTIQGISSHGSTPEKGLNVIAEGARLVQEINYIIANKVSPRSTAVLSIGMFHAGTIPNAIPDYAMLRGTIRTRDEATDLLVKSCFKTAIAKSELEGFNAELDLVGYPAVINHPEAYRRVCDAAKKVVPSALIDAHCQPMAGSEDFSYMINATEGRKGAMFFLGSGNAAEGVCNYLHSNPYYVDEEFMLIGVQIFIHLVTA